MGLTERVLDTGVREEVSDELCTVVSVRHSDIHFAFESSQDCLIQILTQEMNDSIIVMLSITGKEI